MNESRVMLKEYTKILNSHARLRVPTYEPTKLNGCHILEDCDSNLRKSWRYESPGM